MTEQIIINKIIELRKSGLSYSAIAKVLQSDNVPVIGKIRAWHEKAVERIYKSAGKSDNDRLKIEVSQKLDNTQVSESLKAENDRLKAELQEVSQKLDNTLSENDRLKAELKEVSQKLDNTVSESESLELRTYKFKAEFQEVSQKLDKAESALKEVSQKLDNTLSENDRLKIELQKVSQKLDKTESKADLLIPDSVDGWTVVFKDPYYKVYKRIDGKLHWVHLGRVWNTELAQEKIKDYIKDKSL